jgi:hypothetical protein
MQPGPTGETPRHVTAREAELAAAGGGRRAGSTAERIEGAILALTTKRGPDSSICPSDAARAVGGAQWRDLMDETRTVARDLARQGRVLVTSHGRVLAPDEAWDGPVRIRVNGG